MTPNDNHNDRPLYTGVHLSRSDDDVRAIRDETRSAIEAGIEFLRSERRSDPRRHLGARLRAPADEPRLAVSDPQAWLVARGLNAWNQHGAGGAAGWLSPWVELGDPPGGPQGGHRLGRQAVIDRLEHVTAELGGQWVHVADAKSFGDEVLVSLDVRSGRGPSGEASEALT